MKKKGYILCMTTVKTRAEGLKLCRILVKENLAACCSVISGIKSIFLWKGKLCEQGESLCLIKTRAELFHALKKRIKKLHPYDVPEIIAIEIKGGLKEYLDWIDEATIPPASF